MAGEGSGARGFRSNKSDMLLSVDNLAVHFDTEDGVVHAVNGVSFDLKAGETLAIVGESGSGKSVSGLAIMRLLPKRSARIVSGKILFEGSDLLGIDDTEMRKLRGREIAMVFQDPLTSLNPVLTVGKQIAEVFTAHKSANWKQAFERGTRLLNDVGVPDAERVMRSYPYQLSGGMRQRAMIAMGLAFEPKLLIADEPTTALDVTIQAQVLELLHDLTRRSNTSVILITHDLGIVATMAQHVNVMYAGTVVESAPAREIFEHPRHPYTVGLLRSIPRMDEESETLFPIEGSPPDLYRQPVGCPFASRCAWRVARCWLSVPPHGEASPGATEAGSHRVSCYNPVEREEVAVGHPLRDGFQPAAPPGYRAGQPAGGVAV